MFHVDLLTLYKEMEVHGVNFTKPPPDLINGEEEYEVEQVLDSQCHGRNQKIQYLIKWKGYPESDNQWVNRDNMSTNEALLEYQQQYPTAITHIRATSSVVETPSMEFTSTPSPPARDAYELTLPSCSASSSPVLTTAYDDTFANLHLATALQEDLALSLQSSHLRVGQLIEEVSQLLSSEGTNQVLLNC